MSPGHDTPQARAWKGALAGSAGAGMFGMILFLVALSMIFGATILGYFYLRSGSPTWPPPSSPPLPRGLWLSTGILLLVSVAMQWALRGAQRDRQGSLRAALVTTGVLAGVFLVNQARNWEAVRAVLIRPESKAQTYTSIFYILTGTHALHVLAGLVVLGVVTWKAFREQYCGAYHPGVRYSAMYWHFLDVVWLILFAVLLVG
jgi:cytochrome c oxidase subunit III